MDKGIELLLHCHESWQCSLEGYLRIAFFIDQNNNALKIPFQKF